MFVKKNKFILLPICFFLYPYTIFGSFFKTGDLAFTYNHVAIIDVNENYIYVIESVPVYGVRKVTYNEFCKTTKSDIVLKRLKKEYEELIPPALEFVYEAIGEKYNSIYILSEGLKPKGERSFCCSGLIFHAFPGLFKHHPMEFKEEAWTILLGEDKLADLRMQPGIRPEMIENASCLEVVDVGFPR